MKLLKLLKMLNALYDSDEINKDVEAVVYDESRDEVLKINGFGIDDEGTVIINVHC